MASSIVRISRSETWRHEFIRQHDYRCHYCNRFAGSVEVGPDGKPWHVEHMDALANGGADDESNLTLACERCNSLKGTLPYQNFRRYAQSVFWVGEPRRLSLEDLERLEGAFLRTSNGHWMHQDISSGRDEYTARLISIHVEDPDIDAAEVVGEFVATRGRSGGWHNLDFTVLAHRLMPQLVAEIHLLHAELALLRGNPQAPAAA
ncbi:HNH endonuclease signature motif containing protein [Streptomyces sp900105755]|uniref:HNH endonuclease n=1 Tax=Streptomyces sp. 900105755 TaxID=3154389 RepID=UPI00331A9E4C